MICFFLLVALFFILGEEEHVEAYEIIQGNHRWEQRSGKDEFDQDSTKNTK
jgi:hypothetical protein